MLTFQQIILTLQTYWANQGCALLQPYDNAGREFMEYLVEHGSFFDVPAKYLMAEMALLYPVLCRPGGWRERDMEAEANRPAR